jgi:hypothetical protein
MASIADNYGFFWQTLWNLPENADLKQKRKNPNILLAGDIVAIPDKRFKEEVRATDKTYRFQRKGIPSRFRMRLLDGGKPRSGLSYSCEIDGRSTEGKTDEEGEVSFAVAPGAKAGILRVVDGDNTEEYALTFGELDPIDEVTGIQQRLSNLGYDCETTGELDEQTLDALSEFRADGDLAESDSIDGELRSALASAHGS